MFKKGKTASNETETLAERVTLLTGRVDYLSDRAVVLNLENEKLQGRVDGYERAFAELRDRVAGMDEDSERFGTDLRRELDDVWRTLADHTSAGWTQRRE